MNKAKTFWMRILPFLLVIIAFIIVTYIIVQAIKTETSLVNKVQVITNVFLVLSVFFVGYQAYIYKKDYNIKNKKGEIERAIQLAEIYVNGIMCNMSYLYIVYSKLGISKIIENVKSSKMCQFDKDELDELLDLGEIEKIQKSLEEIDTSILLHSRQALVAKKDNILENLSCYVLPDEKTVPSELINTILNNEFKKIKSQTLNMLEYFSMNFNTGIANDEVVYQSLHQTFLKNIKILYYDIARINESGKDKYYTNTIQLFNKWNNKYIIDHKKELQFKRSQLGPNIKVQA